jgi:hypothetical protein
MLFLAKNLSLLLFYVWLKWKKRLLKVVFSFYSHSVSVLDVPGAGATGLAAVLEGLLPELKGKKYDK